MPRPILDRAHVRLALYVGERQNLYKRQTSAHAHPAEARNDDAERDRHLQRWLALFPFLGDQVLAAVAAVHEMDEATLWNLLGNPTGDATPQPPPLWLADIESVAWHDPVRSWTPAVDAELAGLLNLAAPWIEQARRRLELQLARELSGHTLKPCEAASFAEFACGALPGVLLPKIARTAVLELNVRRMRGCLIGETPAARFQHFCQQLNSADDVAAILCEYPVLGRIIAESLTAWAEFSLELFTRLCEDWTDLVATFCPLDAPGTIRAVEWHQGDSHRGGRTVVHVQTTTGLRFVYKPRSLGVDVHFQELLSWINDHCPQLPLTPLTILDRGRYGWVGFVEQAGCQSLDEVDRFYRRLGACLALLYVLDATDIHFENVIACGECPFIVDLETLFHPCPPSPQATADPSTLALRTSVVRVGMLPHRSFASGVDIGIDLSAIGGTAGQPSPFPIPSWQAVGTDEMRLQDDRPVTAERKNRPTIAGKPVELAKFSEPFLTGFRAMYRSIRAHREALLATDGPLARFENAETRVVLRPTVVYASLRQASYHPDVLGDAVDRDALFGWLWVSAKDDPHMGRIVASEARDLRAGDIPLFTTRPSSRDVCTSDSQTLAGFLEEPAMASVRRKLSGLDDGDLERQSWLVRAAFASAATNSPVRERRRVVTSVKCNRSRLIEEAVRIGERVANAAVHDAEGKASWISMVPHAKGRSSIAPVGMALYDGLPGIALFLGHLADLTGERRFERLARQALQTVRAQQDRVIAFGAFDGTAGIAYALAHLGHMWADRPLVAEAIRLRQRITERALSECMFDVISGTAGCLIALLALYEASPREELLSDAFKLGDRLVASALPQGCGRAWTSPISALGPLTGFGHGAAGIGWALLELFQHSRKDTHRSAAIDAFAYERSLYSAANRNWPDLRKLADRTDPSFGLGWCHGAPGILLSRLRALSHLASRDVREEIGEPLAQLDTAFGWGHCLCHGDLGNLETLREAGRALGDQRWHKEYERQLARTFHSGTQNGWLLDQPKGLEAPGLMTGLSGIGFGLLRAAAPDPVPSVLILAPPVPRRSRGASDH
jgi:type 2 lantibiotic biosynthesis protein LanM